jgi:hypothetical protein
MDEEGDDCKVAWSGVLLCCSFSAGLLAFDGLKKAGILLVEADCPSVIDMIALRRQRSDRKNQSVVGSSARRTL